MTLRAGTLLTLAASLAGCATLPPPPHGALAVEAARYACADGIAFTVLFDRDGEGATLTFDRVDRDDPEAYSQDRKFRVVLTTQRPASGIWYAGSGWSLQGKGMDADLSRPDGRISECRAGGGAPLADDHSI